MLQIQKNIITKKCLFSERVTIVSMWRSSLWDRWLYVLAFIVCIMAFGRIHIRVQTTAIGYEIGALKDQESKLLEERARLKMQLSEITTQESLQEFAAKPSANSAPSS